MQSNQINDQYLLSLVTRLENALQNLEASPLAKTNLSSALLTTEKIAAFSDYWNKNLKLLVELQNNAKETKKESIMAITEIAIEAVCAHQDILIASENFKKPVNNDLKVLNKKFSSIVTKCSDIAKADREASLHADAVKNGLDALYWVFAEASYADITQTYYESIDFAGNKIMMQKINEQTKWIKSYKAVIAEVNALVKANYRCGLVWNAKGDGDVTNLVLTLGNIYRSNFKKAGESSDSSNNVEKADDKAKIHEAISSGKVRESLKPILAIYDKNLQQAQAQAQANSNKQKEPVSTTTNTKTTTNQTEETPAFKSKFKQTKRGRRNTLVKKGKKDEFDKITNVYSFENMENEIKELEPENLGTRTVVKIGNCSGTTFKISKKVNNITLFNCEDCTIMADSLISIFEIVNCYKIKVQVGRSIRSFTVDGSTDVTIHLTLDSRDANVLACNSLQIKMRIPKEDDLTDYTEHTLPEQFSYTVSENRKVETKVSDLYSV